MNERQIEKLLTDVKDGSLDVEEAVQRLRHLPFEDIGFAKVDHHRTLRCGFPEVIYCPGKTEKQVAVIDVLVKKTQRAVKQIGAKTVLMGGGVACNGALRGAMENMCDKERPSLLIAPKKYCTDNAVMVASLAYYKYQAGQFSDLTLEPKASSD